MTGSKVVGRRLGFWRGTNPFVLAFVFVICPLCVVLSARYLVGLRHVPNLFEDFGDYLIPSVLAVVGLLMGPIGLWTLSRSRRAYVIVSACPACGFEKQRDFGDAKQKNPTPVACGHCLAYLRVHPKKLVVRELSRDEPSNLISYYGLWSEQYVGIVPRRDDQPDRPFAFTMPQLCAICSAPDAPFLYKIGYCGPAGGTGLLGKVAFPVNYAGKATPSARDDLEEANQHIQTPVCARHKDYIAMERDSGYLCFCSYRYYREFCALNHITEGPDVAYARVHGEAPKAVARVAAAKAKADDNRSAS